MKSHTESTRQESNIQKRLSTQGGRRGRNILGTKRKTNVCTGCCEKQNKEEGGFFKRKPHANKRQNRKARKGNKYQP